MKIADGVEMLELSINVFGTEAVACPVLFMDSGSILLVDTGYPGQLQQIHDAMKKLDISFKKISKIIVTHHDLDHIGNLASIVKELNGDVEVMSHPEEKAYIQGSEKPIKLVQMESRLDALNEQMKTVYEGMKKGFSLSTAKVDSTVADGDILHFCGGIKVIHTPGHTPGHISLYHMVSRTLITGDTMTVEGGRLIPMPTFANYDDNLAGASIRKFTEYDIQNVVCYHGGLFRENPNRRMEEIAKE